VLKHDGFVLHHGLSTQKLLDAGFHGGKHNRNSRRFHELDKHEEARSSCGGIYTTNRREVEHEELHRG
jgi:hypothetical protein